MLWLALANMSFILASISLVMLVRNVVGRFRHICTCRVVSRSTTIESVDAVPSPAQLEAGEELDVNQADSSASHRPFTPATLFPGFMWNTRGVPFLEYGITVAQSR